MEKIIQDTLRHLGVSAIEIKFFITCFNMGPASVNEIARASKIKRSSAYLIAEDLISKQLLKEDFRQYNKKIFAVEPSVLLRMLSAKQRTIGRQEIELKENLAELQSIYGASKVRPRVKVFDGTGGLSSIKEDILSAKSKILLWTNQQTESNFFSKNHHDKFIEIRKKRGIGIKVLAVDNKEGRTLKALDGNNLRETKILSNKIQFTSETYIYDNKIAILDFKKDIIGIIIESEPISASQKAIFNLTWAS